MRLIALITTSFLLMGAEYAWSQQPPQEQRPEQSQPDQAKPQNPVAVETAPEHKEITEPHSSKRTEEQEYSANADPSWLDNFLRIQISDVVIVLATGAIAFFTWKLSSSTNKLWEATNANARMAQKTVLALRTGERAYLTISHRAPGLRRAAQNRWSVVVEIKNHGRTPAAVTAVLLQLRRFGPSNPAPDAPEYDHSLEREIGHFLPPNDSFDYPAEFDMPTEGPRGQLWLVGYVDFRDSFGDGRPFRVGYARVFVPRYTENNLVFIDKRKWNYDRKRKEGEGSDWG